MKHIIVFSQALTICLSAICSVGVTAQKPNIVVIMCDDMGFSDIGCYGGEINTPHIDALSEEGIRFSRFKNAGRCCPSRASLLTGRYQHNVGMGWMTAVDEHRSGYRGQLCNKVPTVAEILKDKGYSTYLSGKWHVTVDGNFKNKTNLTPNGSWPRERGFDEAFGGLSGGGGYYKVSSLIRNETHITAFPDDFYYTDEITKYAVKFIKGHDVHKPLYLHLMHYAPHRPLQAPRKRVDECRVRYKVGYDVLRKKRLDRLKKEGIISLDLELPIYNREYKNGRPSWDSLSSEKKEAWIEEMASYAAMVEIVDDGVGEVVKALKQKGIYDNTIILFLSDNGATNEGGEISQLAADLSNTPYRYYKQFTYNGGVSSPFIIKAPKYKKYRGEIRDELCHIIDVLPTCLDLAGVSYPTKFKEKSISNPDGVTLVPVLRNKKLTTRDLFFEHQTSCAIVSDGYKLVRDHDSNPWELIDLRNDPFETTDISKKDPMKKLELEKKWNAWAKVNKVVPMETLPWVKRIAHYKRLNSDQSGLD
ncbi:MAG: arylsulfatase [Bacteroidales bacterium]|nr:arylsulfatase [Bacteroidales bacterium]